MNFSQLAAELKRRRVFRVAAVYAAVAFVVWQAADIAFPALQLPPWMVTAVVALTILGFPIALVLAWAFEITPQGVKRTLPRRRRRREAPPRSSASWTAQRIAAVAGVAMLASAGGAFVLLGGSFQRAELSAEELDRSIAVLPFANLSDDPGNEYFSDGITDDILTNLSAIGDLRVISRTSVMRYKGTDKSLPQIAHELGVAYILEGTVRRAGGQVRIGAKLVRAATDENLWASNYDREMSDIFAVQTEIARSIADAMQAQLTSREARAIGRRPTENLEAYDYFLRGNEAARRGQLTSWHANALRAIELYSRAVALDPAFALAHARLGELQLSLYAGLWDARDEVRRRAKVAVDRALELDPDLALARLVYGDYLLTVENAPPRAEAEYRRATELQPSDPEALQRLAGLASMAGRHQESLTLSERALALDPENSSRMLDVARGRRSVFDFSGAEQLADAVLSRESDSQAAYALKVEVALFATGDTTRARNLMTTAMRQVGERNLSLGLVQTGQHIYLTWVPQGERALFDLSPADFGTDSLGLSWLHLARAEVHLAAGRRTESRAELQRSLSVLVPLLDRGSMTRMQEATLRYNVGRIHAELGDGASALREGRRSFELAQQPGMEDVIAQRGVALALIHARLGEAAPAVRLLREHLDRQRWMTRGWLRIAPEWDPIRHDPEFQRLIREGSR